MENRYSLDSVDRVMKTLNAFTSETPELRLTDLSERLDLPKSQVLRIVSTLQEGGYLNRDPDTKRYRLGMRLYRLGMMVREQMDLRRIARPVIQSLADQTLETVGLMVNDATGPICVDVIESPKGLRIFAQVGRQMPWNAGASGRVILAFLPEEQRELILTEANFKQYTAFTITDPDQLRPMLAEISATGYHLATQDLDQDAVGVGAPLFDHDGLIVGAISISAPISRVSARERAQMIEGIRSGAAEISRQLGWSAHQAPRRANANGLASRSPERAAPRRS